MKKDKSTVLINIALGLLFISSMIILFFSIKSFIDNKNMPCKCCLYEVKETMEDE